MSSRLDSPPLAPGIGAGVGPAGQASLVAGGASGRRLRLRLAVAIRAFFGGGAQRDMILLCNALAAHGVALDVLTLHSEGPLRALLDPAIRVIDIPGAKLRYAIPRLRRAIRECAPDCIVSSEANLNLCTLLAARTLPRRSRPQILLREVGSPSIAQRRDPYRQNRIAYRILHRLYRHADRVIALTEGARRDLVQNFSVPDRKVAVMRHNAVIPPEVVTRLAAWDGESGRDQALIVCVGRLSPEKDQRTLLAAAALLPKERPWRLAIVGEGPERGALEAFAGAHGLLDRVVFTGQVADPFVWMRRARLAVCSSVYEGLGNAVIEALACGTPVVATDCPYGPAEILAGGRYGRLVPVGDAPAMAAAIATALAETPDRAALRARGLEHTAVRAAAAFLEILGGLRPLLLDAGRSLAGADAS